MWYRWVVLCKECWEEGDGYVFLVIVLSFGCVGVGIVKCGLGFECFLKVGEGWGLDWVVR